LLTKQLDSFEASEIIHKNVHSMSFLLIIQNFAHFQEIVFKMHFDQMMKVMTQEALKANN